VYFSDEWISNRFIQNSENQERKKETKKERKFPEIFWRNFFFLDIIMRKKERMKVKSSLPRIEHSLLQRQVTLQTTRLHLQYLMTSKLFSCTWTSRGNIDYRLCARLWLSRTSPVMRGCPAFFFDVFCKFFRKIPGLWRQNSCKYGILRKYREKERKSQGACCVSMRDKDWCLEVYTLHHHWSIRSLWTFAG